MRQYIIGISILLTLANTSCKKQDLSATENVITPQLSPAGKPALCNMKEDAAKTRAALMNRTTAGTNSSPVVLLLDFNGHVLSNSVWNGGMTWNCPAVPGAQLSAAMKDLIFENVKEDYSAFNITVTKNEADYAAAPAARRMRCVITHKMIPQFGNVGGTAFVGSMAWADNTPCLVFCDPLLYNAQYISGAISHEIGHTFGLQHQSRYDESCSMQEEYHSGEGDGPLSWAPIMGLSYYKNLVTWHNGSSVLGCSDIQSDVSVITSTAVMKADDYKDVLNSNTIILPTTGNKAGCLEQACDIDAFKKNDAGSKRIKISSKGNADIALEVYNQNGALLSVYDDSESSGVNVVVNGKRFFKVRISSNQPFVPVGNGFGSYTIQVSNP